MIGLSFVLPQGSMSFLLVALSMQTMHARSPFMCRTFPASFEQRPAQDRPFRANWAFSWQASTFIPVQAVVYFVVARYVTSPQSMPVARLCNRASVPNCPSGQCSLVPQSQPPASWCDRIDRNTFSTSVRRKLHWQIQWEMIVSFLFGKFYLYVDLTKRCLKPTFSLPFNNPNWIKIIQQA